MQPGEYPQPLQRTNFVFCPLVNGYTTARLGVQNPLSGTTTGTWGTIPDWTITCLLENQDPSNSASVQFVQTPSIASGPRTYMTSAIPLVPGGRKRVTLLPTASFIEITCAAGGPAQLRMQMTSCIELTLEGFNKLANVNGKFAEDPLYPWQIVEPNLPVLGN